MQQAMRGLAALWLAAAWRGDRLSPRGRRAVLAYVLASLACAAIYWAAHRAAGIAPIRSGTYSVHYLLDREWFDPLAAGVDVLPEKHAYSHTIALSSGAQAYLNLGDTKYLRALTNAWRFLEPQRFASGGWAPEEQFVHLGQGRLAESLKTSKAHFETPCGSFADLKLARYLIRFTGRAEYGDGLERTLYNTMLATRLG